MLHGEIKVNRNEIGTWEASRCAMTDVPGEYAYKCTVIYTGTAGYKERRRFFVRHKFTDGALALVGKVVLESAKQMQLPRVGDQTAWLDFCEAHKLNHYSTLD